MMETNSFYIEMDKRNQTSSEMMLHAFAHNSSSNGSRIIILSEAEGWSSVRPNYIISGTEFKQIHPVINLSMWSEIILEYSVRS